MNTNLGLLGSKSSMKLLVKSPLAWICFNSLSKVCFCLRAFCKINLTWKWKKNRHHTLLINDFIFNNSTKITFWEDFNFFKKIGSNWRTYVYFYKNSKNEMNTDCFWIISRSSKRSKKKTSGFSEHKKNYIPLPK